jgi:hypothetical protein
MAEAHQMLFRDAVGRIPSLLTPEQRKKWKELVGEPFYPEPERAR